MTKKREEREQPKHRIVYHWIMSRFDIIRQILSTAVFKDKQQAQEQISQTVLDIARRGNRAFTYLDDSGGTIVEEYEGATFSGTGGGKSLDCDALLCVYRFSAHPCGEQDVPDI